MVGVIPVRSIEELIGANFYSTSAGPTTIVVPGPKDADSLRSLLEHKAKTGLRVETISKFVKDEFSRHFPKAEILQKFELFQRLATLWKAKVGATNYAGFSQTFELFTELRSYSVEESLFQEIYQKFPVECVGVLPYFWAYLDGESVADEQKMYAWIARAHQESKNKDGASSDESIVFWDFNHLNGNQVDMLLGLACTHDIVVPVLESILGQSQKGDWVSWLDASPHEIKRPKEKIAANVVYFPKGRMSEYLEKYILKFKEKKIQMILAKKDIAFNEINEIPLTNAFFKCESPIFEAIFLEVFTIVENFVAQGCLAEELANFLQKKMEEEVSKNVDKRNFRLLKVYMLVKSTLDSYEKLSDLNDKILPFDLRILRKSASLQLPRTSDIPPLFDPRHLISTMGEPADSDLKLICIQETYGDPVSFSGKFSRDIVDILNDIGPVYNPYMELSKFEGHLKHLLEEKETVVFIEEGLLEKNSTWAKVFHSIDLKELENADGKYESIKKTLKIPGIFNKTKKDQSKIFSASKIQSYLDCPQKYYYTYIEKMNPEEKLSTVLLSKELGIIEHQVIGVFLSGKLSLNATNLERIVDEVLNNYLRDQQKHIDILTKKRYREEILVLSGNGIEEIYKIISILPGDLHFEFKVDFDNVTGSIDILIETLLGDVIIDFKRSSGGVPSSYENENFQKIQIWTYLYHSYLKRKKKIILWGFLNLTEPSQSLLYSIDSKLCAQLVDVRFCSGQKILPVKYLLEEKLEEFKEFLFEKIDKIEKEREFPPVPRTLSVCQYCPVSIICTKGEEYS